MSRKKGPGVTRSKRTRVPLAATVKFSAPLPPFTSTVSMPSPPSLRSLPSPGFQIDAVVAGLAEGLVVAGAAGEDVVAVAAEEQVGAALAEQRVVAGLAEELVRARAAGQRVVAAPPNRWARGQRAVGLVERDGVVAAQSEHLDQRRVGDRRNHGVAVAVSIPVPVPVVAVPVIAIAVAVAVVIAVIAVAVVAVAGLVVHGGAVYEQRAGGVAADDDRVVGVVPGDREDAGARIKGRRDRKEPATLERVEQVPEHDGGLP